MKDKLKVLGLTKKEFAREVGYGYDAVVRWGDSPPVWVGKYLDLMIRERLYRKFWVAVAKAHQDVIKSRFEAISNAS